MRHRAGGRVEANDLRARRAGVERCAERLDGVVHAEAIPLDLLDDRGRAREGCVGVPDDQDQLPVVVCRHDQRLREHAADE